MAARSFWLRVDAGGGKMSDAFRVRFKAEEGNSTWKSAEVEDLKEQMLDQAEDVLLAASPTGSTLPLPWLYLWVSPRPDAAGLTPPDAPGWKQLLASETLGSLPEGAGEGTWPLVVRVVPGNRVQTKPVVKPKKKPETLFEKGIADESEHEQIKNAKDLSELYPGGVLPRTGPNDFTLVTLAKVFLVFAIYIAFGAFVMWFLGSYLPTLLPPPNQIPYAYLNDGRPRGSNNRFANVGPQPPPVSVGVCGSGVADGTCKPIL